MKRYLNVLTALLAFVFTGCDLLDDPHRAKELACLYNGQEVFYAMIFISPPTRTPMRPISISVKMQPPSIKGRMMRMTPSFCWSIRRIIAN